MIGCQAWRLSRFRDEARSDGHTRERKRSSREARKDHLAYSFVRVRAGHEPANDPTRMTEPELETHDINKG